MFSRVIVVVSCLLAVSQRNLGQEFGLIGEALELGSPCKNGAIYMERFIGGPPSKENYWNGSINFDIFKKVPEARVTLRLTAPATVTLDEEDGRMLTSDDAFHITFFKQDDGSFHGKFQVRGRPRGDFPNLLSLHLNEVDICPDKSEWKPSLLGAGNTGSVDLINRTDTVDGDAAIKCGRRKVQHQGLITNGFPSQEGDWPWHAAIYHIERRSSAYKCGGTLISSKAVITAGHCVTENLKIIVPERVLVKLGLHNRLVSSTNTQEFRIFKIIVHDKYDPLDLKNDIAILKLGTEVSFSNYVQPVCMWDKSSTDLNQVINEAGYVVGWGFNEDDVLTDVLSQAKMPVVSLTTCLNSNRPFFGNFLTETNFCAGFRNGTSVCNGDSGGGMFFKENSVFKLRGIVSLSASREDKNVCNTKHYVIFTDCAKYLDWIASNSID